LLQADLLEETQMRAILGLLVVIGVSTAQAADPVRPDPALSPGDWYGKATGSPTPLAAHCAPRYTQGLRPDGSKVRNVPKSLKSEVVRRYGYDPSTFPWQDYEIDHVVSLELDGTNDITNLFPQSYKTPLNAHHKDVLENFLHRQVCENKMPLAQAQQEIATDWVAAYQKYVLHHE
jgi:hypothetical protein